MGDNEAAMALAAEIDWHKALGITEWVREACGEDSSVQERARALGCVIEAQADGTSALSLAGGEADIADNDARLAEDMARDAEIREFCRCCALDRDELGDVCVAAGSPHYWNEVFYVYRDIEAYLSGLGRSPWFDADWEYWHQL